ncbi:uncharacterized protein LOC132269939 [Cornus florida]|uniref:uncharacterized protein LOC132269939 n=1 Tax=Cornus florida TaxID=4283 RepID=UPI00289E3A2B|nr:uncharacterized protein LOC132269939 [Cornus florida]
MLEEAPAFDSNQGQYRRDKPPEFGHHKIASPWKNEFAGYRSSDPPYQPSMATIDYKSSERKSTDDRIPSQFSRENEALRSLAKTVASPFTDEILNAPNPRKFSMSVFILFNLVKSMVMECHPSTAVQAFKLAMNRGTPFHTSLVVNTPKTMDELNEGADGFVHLEEEEVANTRKTSIISTEEKSKAKIRQKQAQPQRQTSWKAEKRPREEEVVTLLRVTLTNEYKNLRRQVEMLIARREFVGYVQGPAQKQNRLADQVKRTQKQNNHNTQLVRIINVINGRPEQTTESKELLRTRLRQTQMKRRIGSTPHEDPLVISLTVAECLVRRVLIDPGSSANIMPRVTFDRLEVKPEKLKPTGNPLLGFDGKLVDLIGMVELTVQAAERVLTEIFVVVEIHPSYNLLMGRRWIHRVQGVPSTLHQVIRCLGPDGNKVIDIHGDQVAAKEFYTVTLKSAGKGKAPIRSANPK